MAAPAPIPPTLLPGDLLPPLALPDATGAAVDLFHQSLAGLSCVLVIGRPPADPAAAQARAAAKRARLFLVARARPDGLPQPEGAPVRLFDAEGRLAAGLGLAGDGVAVISPRGRLAFLRAGMEAPGGAPEEVLEMALDLLPEPPAAPPPVLRGGAPALIIPDVLEPAFIAALLAHWEKGEKTRDRVASTAGAANAAQNIKRRTDVWLDDQGLYATYRLRLERRVLPELWRAYRFRAASFEMPRIGCYDASDAGGFGAHRDNRTPYTAHRRFAMSLNLNTGAYAGGALNFPEFGPELYEPPAGGAVLFCCDLLHEAMPVTAGRRFAIFTFLTDAAGAEQEKRLIAERQAAGEKGVRFR
ncbi:2OG-Fe(II) oxygenase [Roseomonas sp. GC11]|uniref:2OG-Fe(II) oxygenase family protein n=1 Tax=Roseomonas sp. GC11 TaxID=2950546 RepID=UPI00210CFD76|nr:2OG-Fe(II) oxygenase [Roseomonas sp. GC11]MCQ4159016.1 2OG-Fe(II) oxygenase [Roseomonas sp. GC11]